MGFAKLLEYLEGSLTIQADGEFLERFLTVCIRRNLGIRNVRHLGERRLCAEMDLAAFRHIRPVCRRTRTHLTVLKRNGFPFLLQRLKHRKFALLGLLAAILFLWYTTCHIMGITIIGNSRIDTATLREHLARSGIAIGKSTAGIDSDQIRNRMMRDLDELAWVGINVSGSRIYVEIVERLEKEPGIDQNTPCHLIAAKDGEILAIEAREGQTMVSVGSGVREGDLLVSGMMDNDTTGFRLVHAWGEVFAKTIYTETKDYPLTFLETTDTGESTARYSITLLDKTLPLYFGKAPYPEYRQETTETEYRLPFERLPSLWVRKDTFTEQTTAQRTRTAAEAIQTAKEELFPALMAQIPANAEVISKELTHTLTEQGTVQATATVYCRENIAVKTVIETEISD